jgi:hypothetical protein
MLTDKQKLRQALWRRQKIIKQRKEILQILGQKCLECGYDDERALVIDHVNSGGSKERQSIGGGYYSMILKKLKEGTREYQTLCCNCNQIKRLEKDEEMNRKY